MSQLDSIKETIAYLRFWLGVMVVSDISLLGWLLSGAGATSVPKAVGAIISIIIITFSAFLVHKRIELLISKLKDL